jgi:hypothetical protein
MKKFGFVLFTILLCTAFAVAQATGSAGAGTASGQSSTSGSTVSDQTGASSRTGATDANQTSTATNDKGKTIEGCIVKESTEYYLQPKHGKLERLSSTEDLSAHVGHQVKVHGRESKDTGGSSAGASTTSSTSGSTAGGVSGQATASGTTSNPTSGASGQSSVAGSSGNTSASGGMSVDKSKIGDKMITVEKVDMVSETCSIGNNKNKDKGSETPKP